MTMTDPVADMLTRIRNANVAMHEGVNMPSSKQKVALADILKSEGYIRDYAVSEAKTGPGQVLNIEMKYSPERERVISGVKRVSKPGRRVYMSVKDIPSVRQGLGVSIVSTPKGVMSDANARAANVGGEVL